MTAKNKDWYQVAAKYVENITLLVRTKTYNIAIININLKATAC